ncbi:hypothetical protein [Microbacterium arborescens]|jgi:hypothetical protein|uniref:hypothetical protein n=1 Tax=Microbacterium TaxID=33882 RepID=UPI0025A2A945|nr:hypothetical protein [Microbacterium arborescens]MDF2580072.1 hypothetical protein [Microbacterium sp.]WJM16405.1 hypothetical protein QUC20_03545 [Microbacterium arborescens]
MNRDLPEGVVDPDGAGATSLAASEAEDDAVRDADTPADAAAMPDGDSPDGFVESAEIQQGLDPDLVTDEQADEEEQR